MIKKLYTEANIQDIADAIRAKNGSSDTYTTAEMPAAIQAIPTGGGSANVVNGIIEYYKAKTTTISANTFVEFVNGSLADSIVSGLETALSSGTQSNIRSSAVALDSSTVFIAYSSIPYGVVCSISGTTITAGSETSLFSTNGTGSFEAVALDSSTVFIVRGADSSECLYGVVCSISGTTITAGSETQLSMLSKSGYEIKAVALDSAKVFISYRGNSSYFYAQVCSISGTTITAGSETQLSSLQYAYGGSSAVALDSSTVFIAHRGNDGTYNRLYGVVCSISGTTITVGTDTLLSGDYYNNYDYISAVALDSSTVFIAHNSGSTASSTGSTRLYGVVCSISGTTITAGTDTLLSSSYKGYLIPSAVALDSAKVFISYGGYGNSNPLYGLAASGSKTIRASTSQIDGLTKTEATTSTAGDVWVLNN